MGKTAWKLFGQQAAGLGAFCAAFFVVLFVVLLIVTEGDAADGIGDVFVGGVGDGSKTRKRRKKP